MTDFQFGVGEWETNRGDIAVVLHQLTDPNVRYPLIGYIQISDGRQELGSWQLNGAFGNNPSSIRSLKRPQPKPREYWINLYPTKQYAHKTRDNASVKAIPNLLIACVHVREVLEEETDG